MLTIDWTMFIFPVIGCLALSVALLYSRDGREYLLKAWGFAFLLGMSCNFFWPLMTFFVVLLGPLLLLAILGFGLLKVILMEQVKTKS